MKTVQYSTQGDSSVLSVVQSEPGTPGAGDVRVQIVVSGVNPADWQTRAGVEGPMPFPIIVPGLDGAGIVDEVGAGVTHVRAGDRVWLFLAEGLTGTAQESVVAPATLVVRLPDSASFEVGASLGVPALTAHRALTTHDQGPARLSAGALDSRTVLVAGGAGAVGHAAIQLARWAGATVIATVSNAEKAELARAAGAHHVLRYSDDDIADQLRTIAPDGVDHVVEVSPHVNAALDISVLANHGCIAFYADLGGDDIAVPVVESFAKNARWQGLLMYNVGAPARNAAVEDITAALESHALPVGAEAGLPLTWFPLDDTGHAHDAVEQGLTGKALIRLRDE